MTLSKSHWRHVPASDDFADLDSQGGYEYESTRSEATSSFSHQDEHDSGASMTRARANSTKSRRSSLIDAECEEDGQWNEDAEKESKRKSRKKPETPERLVKRRDQNRVSQRAFRQRKERHTKELEAKVEELEILLERSSHKNSIAQSEMGRMEEELSYYRTLLFAGASQNRIGFSLPPSRDTCSPLPYASIMQEARTSSFSTPSTFQSSGFDTSQSHMTSPYLATYQSPPEARNSLFASHRYEAVSTDSCSTPNRNSTRSCSPSSDSPAPFMSSLSATSSPIMVSTATAASTSENFGNTANASFWGVDISGWNEATLQQGGDVSSSEQYLRKNTNGWEG